MNHPFVELALGLHGSQLMSLQKRMFAEYWDHVDDPRDISGVSRFLSGGLGGISSQLSAYMRC